jgi:hypothetical protein
MSEQTDNLAIEDAGAQARDPLEVELEAYPLRDASEDPRWAVRTVWIWVGIAIFLLLFLITLFILGLWFD